MIAALVTKLLPAHKGERKMGSMGANGRQLEALETA